MNIALIIVAVYMFLLLFVAWASAMFRRNSSAEAFLLANKQLSWPLVGVMIAGIAVGGSSTVGIAQNAYTTGMSAGWYDVAWAAGAIIVGFGLATHIRGCGFDTINKMLEAVFGSKFSLVSTGIQVIINTVIIALQIIAGGAILTALMPDVFTMKLGIVISAAMFGLISFVGGLTAASVSNVVNIAVIYVGLIIGLVATVSHFGDFETINSALPAGLSGDGSHWYSLVSGMGPAAILAWFVTMIVDAVPNGGVIQNIIAARSPLDAKKGAIFAGLLMIPAGFMSAVFGIVAAAYFPGLESSALALPSVVMELPSWVAGILLAGLWAADVSTATGLMMGVSTMVSEDIIFKYFLHRCQSSKAFDHFSWGLFVGDCRCLFGGNAGFKYPECTDECLDIVCTLCGAHNGDVFVSEDGKTFFRMVNVCFGNGDFFSGTILDTGVASFRPIDLYRGIDESSWLWTVAI